MTKTKTKTKTRTKSPAPVPESIVNDAPRTFTDSDFPVGTAAHQGDLILVRIVELPQSVKTRANRQLADGTTQGSRHVVKRGEVFDADPVEVAKAIKAVCPKASVEARYVGPVFRTIRGKADLTHPEHGNHLYREDMVIATVFQRNLDAEEREHRTVD